MQGGWIECVAGLGGREDPVGWGDVILERVMTVTKNAGGMVLREGQSVVVSLETEVIF